jgi:hypothetical protein
MENNGSKNLTVNCRWHEDAFQNRSKLVVNVGLNVLGPTALTNGHSVSELDNYAIDEIFDVIYPDSKNNPDLANWNGRGGLVEHCYFSGEIAFKLTTEVNKKLDSNINPYAQKAALKLHDLGRTAINSFMETDELTDIFWQQIGLRTDLKDMTHSAHLYWSDDSHLNFDDISISKRISIASDIFGKWSQNDPRRLRHKEEILEAVKKGKEKYLHKQNPTKYEDELVKRLPNYTQKEQYAISMTLEWLDELGVDINKIVDEVIEERHERILVK